APPRPGHRRRGLDSAAHPPHRGPVRRADDARRPLRDARHRHHRPARRTRPAAPLTPRPARNRPVPTPAPTAPPGGQFSRTPDSRSRRTCPLTGGPPARSAALPPPATAGAPRPPPPHTLTP